MRKLYSPNDEETRREVTGDKHCQETYRSWEMEKRVVTGEAGGGQRRQQDSCTSSCRARGTQALQMPWGVEEAGDTATTEVRGTGLWYVEQPIPKQQTCSQRYIPSWRVQSKASKAGASASNIGVLMWCRLTANLPRDQPRLTLKYEKKMIIRHLGKKVSGINKRYR